MNNQTLPNHPVVQRTHTPIRSQALKLSFFSPLPTQRQYVLRNKAVLKQLQRLASGSDTDSRDGIELRGLFAQHNPSSFPRRPVTAQII